MTWPAMIILATLSVSSVTAILPDANTAAEGLHKQAELIEAQAEQIALLEEKVALLEAAIDQHRRAEVSLKAEAESERMVADSFRKLWQAEMEAGNAERRRSVWAERFVALKWGLAGAAAGVLAMEVAK